MGISVSLTVNGQSVTADAEPRTLLVTFLREHLALTGTHVGCDTAQCGACTVLLDGVAVNACLVPAPQAEGRQITTVEGLAEGQTLTPLQEAFLDHEAVHCGYCTPGMLMSAKALLEHTPSPSEDEIRVAISGNICRCSGYVQIVEAIDAAAKQAARDRG